MIRIAVVNRSTVVTDAEVQAFVPALQIQISRDFAPYWCDAQLRFTASPDAGEWQLVILDDSDQAGALGYHDVTAHFQPLGKVFAKTVKQYGDNWEVTASHEALEMLGDPNINLLAQVADGPRSAIFYAYETCDACEDDRFAYEIDGHKVSDFVLPAWFEPGNKVGPFDFKRHITKPLELLKGGYIGAFNSSRGHWSMETAERDNARAEGQPGSRRERRARKWETGEVVPSTAA